MTARKSRHDRPEVQYGQDNIGGVCSMLKLNISIEPLQTLWVYSLVLINLEEKVFARYYLPEQRSKRTN